MTVKLRGIQLKDHLSPNDQGQRKLMQVMYSQLGALDPARADSLPADCVPPPQRHDTGTSRDARRRAIARMLRVELEATLALLDRALSGPPDTVPPTGAKQS